MKCFGFEMIPPAPPPSSPFLDIFFQNLRPKYAALKPKKSIELQDIYWAILLCLSMFGFFGLGAFPIILELAVITFIS